MAEIALIFLCVTSIWGSALAFHLPMSSGGSSSGRVVGGGPGFRTETLQVSSSVCVFGRERRRSLPVSYTSMMTGRCIDMVDAG